jgi:hypothetical protein
MKFFHSLLRWLPCYLLIIATILVCYWEENLPLSYSQHAFLWIATLIISGILLSRWITANECNLLVTSHLTGPSSYELFLSESNINKDSHLEQK